MGTTVFAALAALTRMLADTHNGVPSVTGLEDVDVMLGGPKTTIAESSLHVGVSPDGLAFDGRQEPGLDWNHGRTETYDIAMTGYTLNGDADMAAAMVKAELLYHTVERVVQADITLSGTVETAGMGARLIGHDWQATDGAVVELQFTVNCKGYPDNA